MLTHTDKTRQDYPMKPHRQNGRIKRLLCGLLALALLLPVLVVGPRPHAARAAEFTPCNASDLITAITTADGNGEADTITLDAGCTYTLTSKQTDAGLPNITSSDKLTINGNGATIERDSSSEEFRILYIDSGAEVEINDLTITGGSVPHAGFGGADQDRNDGGGIYNAGTLTINNSTISGNKTSIYSFSDGGGIANNEGTLTINNSTISGNTADNNGGGMVNYGFSGTVSINNSTISNNTVDFGRGGGIYNKDGTLTISSSTISNNTVTAGSGGGLNNEPPYSTTTIKNTIVANNSAPSTLDCSGTITSAGYNLIEKVATCTIAGDTTGNITSQDPNLGALADNGGPTHTHALQSGSLAIDAGNPAGCTDTDGNALTTDQRGESRLEAVSGTCDIGAYEISQYTLTVTKAGTGSGTVESDVAGITCGSDCTDPFAEGTDVTLTATADSGSAFAGWSGDCASDGSVTMNSSKTCTATFTSARPELDLNGAGDGLDTTVTLSSGQQTATVAPDLTITDDDSATLEGAIVTLTNPQDTSAESLEVDTSSTSINASYESASGKLTLSGADSVSNYQTVLSTLTFSSTTSLDNTPDRTITVTVSDETGDSNTATATLETYEQTSSGGSSSGGSSSGGGSSGGSSSGGGSSGGSSSGGGSSGGSSGDTSDSSGGSSSDSGGSSGGSSSGDSSSSDTSDSNNTPTPTPTPLPERNDPPESTDIPDQSIPQNGSTTPILFNIGDSLTSSTDLNTDGQSSNPNLVPPENIVIECDRGMCTVTITPAPGQVGETTITITVEDTDGLIYNESFDLTVGEETGFQTLSCDNPETITIPFAGGTHAATTERSYTGAVEALVMGTGQTTDQTISDAFYVTGANGQNPTAHPDQYNHAMWVQGQPLRAFITASVPAYRDDHAYRVSINAMGGPLTFGVGDMLLADNSGAYEVMLCGGTETQAPVSQPTITFPLDQTTCYADPTRLDTLGTVRLPDDIPTARLHTEWEVIAPDGSGPGYDYPFHTEYGLVEDGHPVNVSVEWPGVYADDSGVQVDVRAWLGDAEHDRPLLREPVSMTYAWDTEACDTQPATEAPAGSISGRVVDSVRDALPAATVELYRFDGASWWHEDNTQTDDDGRYRFDGLTVGAYQVHFVSPDAVYMNEYYQNAATLEQATTIALAKDEMITKIDAILDPVPAPPVRTETTCGAPVVVDPATGQVMIGRVRDNRVSGDCDVTVSAHVACTDGDAENVVLTMLREAHGRDNATYPMNTGPDGAYTATIPSDDLPPLDGDTAESYDLALSWVCGDSSQERAVGRVLLFDPSGQITNAVTGAPIAGAEVTLHKVPGWRASSGADDSGPGVCQSNLSRAADEDWSQTAPTELGVPVNVEVMKANGEQWIDPLWNPQVTGANGYYGWDVAGGCWYIEVTADGYETQVSPVVGVPPEVTDLHVALQPLPTTQADGTPLYLPTVRR